jgi:hypothetical protein
VVRLVPAPSVRLGVRGPLARLPRRVLVGRPLDRVDDRRAPARVQPAPVLVEAAEQVLVERQPDVPALARQFATQARR